MMARALVMLAAAVAHVAARDAPTLTAEGESIFVDANDLVLRSNEIAGTGDDGDDDGPKEVSFALLYSTVNALSAKVSGLEQTVKELRTELDEVRGTGTAERSGITFDDVATTEEVADEVESLEGAVESLAGNADAKSTATNVRIDTLTKDVAGFADTKATVADLAKKMAYVLSHAENVTACAADGTVHSGDGDCVDPIPQCPKPSTPGNEATMVLSSTFIIPGTTAKYACPKEGTFLQGNEVRTCSQQTEKFTGSDPACLACNVLNCKLCAGGQDKCAECEYGHDLSLDKKACSERKDSIIVLEGGVPNARHNHNFVEQLEANSAKWGRVLPSLPYTATNGAGALIKGTLYHINEDYRTNTGVYYKLPAGATKWESFPSMGNNADVTPASFFATLNGVGTKEDGFYCFSTKSSAVFKPGENKWTQLEMYSSDKVRNRGATAVVGSKIYLLGGITQAGQVVDQVDVLDTSSGRWAQGTAMKSARGNHAAASFGGKIFVFGGYAQIGVAIDVVEMFDPKTSNWAKLTAMPEAWAEMTTGPLPVFANGVVLIPHSYRNKRAIVGSLKYDTIKDTWVEGPKMNYPCGRYVALIGSRD